MTEEQSTSESRTATEDGSLRTYRRETLALLGLGGLGLATGSASGQSGNQGQQPFYNWDSDVDANGHNLQALGALEMDSRTGPIEEFAGDNLSVDDGTLHADVPAALHDGQPMVEPLSDFHQGDGGGAAFGNVVFALDEEEIVVVYRDDDVSGGSGGHGGDGYLVQRRTTDGGETWSDRRTIFDTDGVSDRDPRGGITPDGTLILFFIRTVVGPDTVQDGGFLRSTNGGRTWSDYQTVDDRGWGRSPIVYGKLISVERDGETELLYPVWGSTDYDDPEGALHGGEVWVISSTDDGRSWQYKGTIIESPAGGDIRNETDIVDLPNGDLLAMVRRLDTTGYEQYYSTDGGETWTYDGLANIGITGYEAAPILTREGNTLKFFATHRSSQYTERHINYLSYSTADAQEIVGSPKSWSDHIWFVQDGRMNGYPHVSSAGDETFVTFNWSDGDGHYNHSMIRERDIKRLIAGRQHVRYDSVVDARAVAGNAPVYFDSQEALVAGEDPPDDEWLTADVSDLVPVGAQQVFLTPSVESDGSDDGRPSYVAFRNPARSGQNYDGYVTAPGDSGSIVGDTVTCSLSDEGTFEWLAERAEGVWINVTGFR